MWWMLALAVNAQSPAPSQPPPTAMNLAPRREAAALRAELDQALRFADTEPVPDAPKAMAAPASTRPARPIPAVGSATGGELGSTGSWAALALGGAAIGGFSLWRRRQRNRSSLLSIRETAPLGKGKLLAIVDTGGRRLLLGVTEHGVQLLANEAQPAEPLAALARTPDAPTHAPAAGVRFDDHLPPLEGEELRKKLAARFA